MDGTLPKTEEVFAAVAALKAASAGTAALLKVEALKVEAARALGQN